MSAFEDGTKALLPLAQPDMLKELLHFKSTPTSSS